MCELVGLLCCFFVTATVLMMPIIGAIHMVMAWYFEGRGNDE